MGRSKHHADCLAPALTVSLHFLFIAPLLPSVACLRQYAGPVFLLYSLLVLLTLGALGWVASRDPGFVTCDLVKETSTHNVSYKNTCDKTVGVGEVSNPVGLKGKKKAEDPNNAAVYLPSKEDSAKGTENYKYYEFSDPTPINLHTEEDSRVAEDEGKPEIQGEAGSQLHSLDNLPQYRPRKQEIAPISRDIDTEKDKMELDTSEVREIARSLDAVSTPNPPSKPANECEKGKFEDVDLTAVQGILVEIRYCIVCKTEQPLRAKHCKDCGVCVALHDHHCPWLGVCIGERTRCYFYVYLCLETGLMWVTLAMAVSGFEGEDTVWEWVEGNGLLLGDVVIVGFFTVMVTCLLGFHTYLAANNLTTCIFQVGEVASWTRISYLKQWPRAYGSPFSKGLGSNLLAYCCKRLPRPYTVWVMPKTLPAAPTSLCC